MGKTKGPKMKPLLITLTLILLATFAGEVQAAAPPDNSIVEQVVRN